MSGPAGYRVPQRSRHVFCTVQELVVTLDFRDQEQLLHQDSAVAEGPGPEAAKT